MSMLRKHQAQLSVMVDKVIAGAPWNTFLGLVTPGGGKSALPIIMGKLVSSGLADAICWVVPRLTLQYQGEGNFVDPLFRKMLRHSLAIRSSTNDQNPCRGLHGFITTYQAISLDFRGSVLNEFQHRRYVLILDEFHHIEEKSTWFEALAPIVKAAAFRLFMTGSVERGNKNKIGFMPYKTTHETENTTVLEPIMENTDKIRTFTYTRKDALSERAIIPLRFYLHDGNAKWKTKDGDKYEMTLRKAPESLARSAVYTALHTAFAGELLRIGITHWREYKKKHRTSRLLVVCADINLAMKAKLQLSTLGMDVDIATSADSASAKKSIRRFKEGVVHILVGVALFYEGFDCKQVSHIISLTHIRSTPWIFQMVARAVRIDPDIPYDGQFGYVFAPDDVNFREIVERIRLEQLPTIEKHKNDGQMGLFDDDEDDDEDDSGDDGEIDPFIIPIRSDLTQKRETVVGLDEQDSLPFTVDMSEPIPLTPSDHESTLRSDIETHVRIYCRNTGFKHKRINGELRRHFNKARGEMTVPELIKVRDHLKDHYPHNTRRRPAMRTRAVQLEARP